MAYAAKCPCGDEACKDWHVHPQAAIQGVNFTKKQAVAVANLLTTLNIKDLLKGEDK